MTPFDEELRRRLSRSIHITIDEEGALAAVRPRLKRARRIRRAMVGSTAALLLGGVAYAGVRVNDRLQSNHELRTLQPSPEKNSAPAPTAPQLVIDATGETDAVRPAPTPPALPGSEVSVSIANPDGTVPAEIEIEPNSSDDVTITSPAATPTESTTATADPPPPAPTSWPDDSTEPSEPETTESSAPATTVTAPPTSAAQPSKQSLVSDCGTVTVDVAGNRVTLASTAPLTGFHTDIKEDGPKVEVGFSDGVHECEITAWVHLGVFRSSIDNHHESDE